MHDDRTICAVLVMDVCDSTGLYESAGDTRAHGQIVGCLSMAARRIERAGGKIIKSVGDGLIGSLPTAGSALKAAKEMQEEMSFTSLSIRVGLNFGAVLQRERDMFGDTVNVAAHLTSHAKAHEIVMTEEFVHRLPLHLRNRAQFFDRVAFKGRERNTEIYRMPLNTEAPGDVTLIHLQAAGDTVISPRLVLRHNGLEYVVEGDGGEFSIGRDRSCALVVEGPFVSRRHGSFRVRRGRFQFREMSANGSWVAYGDGQPQLIKREVVRLQGGGVISLGEEIVRNTANLIHFECRGA